MRIEEVEELDARLPQVESDCACDARCVAETAVEALRAEAWHPIEKAEEMGAKDGREVLGWTRSEAPSLDASAFWLVEWDDGNWYSPGFGYIEGISHFRFINPPEGA